MKKFTFILAVMAMLVCLIPAASAEVNKDDHGIITWTFGSPETAQSLGTSGSDAYNYYLYDSSISEVYTDKATALAAATENSLLLQSNDAEDTIGAETIKIRKKILTIYYTPKENGTMIVEGSNIEKKMSTCTAKKEWSIAGKTGYSLNNASIAKITFVPDAATKTLTFTAKDALSENPLAELPNITLKHKATNAEISGSDGVYTKLYGTYTYTAVLTGYGTLTGDVTITDTDKTVELEMFSDQESVINYVDTYGNRIAEPTKKVTTVDDAVIYYPVVINKDGIYYRTEANTTSQSDGNVYNFGRYFGETQGAANITYERFDNCVYYAEGETALSGDVIKNVKSSNGEEKLAVRTVKDGEEIKTQGNEFSTTEEFAIGTYKVTVAATGASDNNEHIIVAPGNEGNSAYLADITIMGRNGYQTKTETFTSRKAGIMNITYKNGSRVNLDYIYIEKLPVDIEGNAAYVGAYTADGAHTFTEADTAESKKMANEGDGATVYKAAFSNPPETVYTNPTIEWAFEFGDTAPQVGTYTKTVPANDSVNQKESVFGLVINGVLLDKGDTSSISATLKNGQ